MENDVKEFRGLIQLRGDDAYLSSGGIVVSLNAGRGSAAQIFGSFAGRTIAVIGRQQGATIVDARPAAPMAESALRSRFEPVLSAIMSRGDSLSQIEGVVAVRPGFKRIAGQLLDEPAVVVAVARKEPARRLPEAGRIPSFIGGVPVDVVVAGPDTPKTVGADAVAAWRSAVEGASAQAEVEEAERRIGYKPPPDLALNPVAVDEVVCHVGPDSGWSTLKPFLEAANSSLTVAMYDYTASHVSDTMEGLGRNRPNASLAMILDERSEERERVDQLRKSWGERLNYVRAWTKAGGLFANSYHTKIAVRDGTAMWLSSGNWSPNSQPNLPSGANPTIYRAGNREWHVIVPDLALSKTFERFIKWDIAEARRAPVSPPEAARPDLLVPEGALLELEAAAIQPEPFAAKTIRASGAEDKISIVPLLTPDNYTPAILDLIGSAKESLYMQYSYVRAPGGADKFRELIVAVARKMAEGVDVRVIVDSRNQKDEHVDVLLALGWQTARFRKQISKVHNKGIIVDGKIAVVGSHNWSSDGTQYNRDASLIFRDPRIAAYFGAVFLFDWQNLTKSVREAEITPMLAEPDGPTPPGMVRIPWSAWYGE